MTSIEWTGSTWNPIVGCSKISAGCQHCYAIKEAHRLAGNPNPKISSVYSGLTERRSDRTEWTGLVKFIPERLEIPLKTRKPTTWFVNSMSDLFHPSVTLLQILEIWEVMRQTPQHVYQILTKRPERMQGVLDWMQVHDESNSVFPLPNVWLGVTIENQRAADERVPLLLQTPAAVRFLSCEPLLEQIDLRGLENSKKVLTDALTGVYSVNEYSCEQGNKIDWVIVGGESGPKARPCNIDWMRSLVRQCQITETPVFVKQLGCFPYGREHGDTSIVGKTGQLFGNGPWRRLSSPKGNDFSEFPADLKVRQLPVCKKS